MTYLEVLNEHYPGLLFECFGSPYVFENINCVNGEMPSKTEVDQFMFEDRQRKVWRRIQEERDRRIAGGVKIGDHWFHTDNTSRIQQLALVIFGSNLPANIMWKTMGGSFVELTPTLCQQIFQASATQDMTIFTAAEQHKAQMLASPNPEEYDFSGGWPDTMYSGPLVV